MKPKTSQRAKAIKDALLAMPEEVIVALLKDWYHHTNEHFLDAFDEVMFELGFGVQSDETKHWYSSWESYIEAEPDSFSASISPMLGFKAHLEAMTTQAFYHVFMVLAGDALQHLGYTRFWGDPPTTYSDGYKFMDNLAAYLSAEANYYRRMAEKQINPVPYANLPIDAYDD